MSRPRYVNVFQWNRECFFLRHEELNSRFIVMKIDEVTLDRPEVGTDFSVICWFCQLRLFVVSSWQFCCTICDWDNEFIIFWMVNTSFALILPGLNIWCIQLSKSSRSAIKISPFQIPPRLAHKARKIPGCTFLPNWWILDWFFGEDG